jgi:hypothetical protein
VIDFYQGQTRVGKPFRLEYNKVHRGVQLVHPKRHNKFRRILGLRTDRPAANWACARTEDRIGNSHGPHRAGGDVTNTLMKTKDTRKETKKMPTKTAKEKKLAKQAKKNSK